MASNSLNIITRAREIEQSLPAMEYELGKGLLQPFNNTNSGARKIMQGIQKEQAIQVLDAETPLIMTGFENQFGEYSSSFVRADQEYTVLTKVFKNPKNYWVLAYDTLNMVLTCFHRISYEHVTEMFGYNLDTHYLDSLKPGDTIQKGDNIIRSASFDIALNKCDGINLTTVYMAFGLTTEDPIVLSQSAASRFVSPLFDNIEVVINDNDVPLNLYGDDSNYKSFPDIGEYVKNGIFCAVRRERKDDEALYAQSCEKLRQLMMSDETYISSDNGMVIDIDVYCNNIEKLDVMYNSQIAKYYNLQMQFCKNMVATVNAFMKEHPKYTMSYEMQKIYTKCKNSINGVQFIKDKVFNNIVIDVMVRAEKPISVGDKITDRYGGKGVISAILPDDIMPKYKRFGEYHTVDAIYNSSTIVNRENPGQSFETEITFIGEKIVEAISEIWPNIMNDDIGEMVEWAEDMVYRYLAILAPKEAEDYKSDVIDKYQNDLSIRKGYIMDIVNNGGIYVVMQPISSNMNIDVLRRLYAEFPWIEMDDIYVVQKDSTGKYRRIKARRKLVTGKKYIYRLKQLAKEKFSAVSLASTNIRSENTKTKANKLHKSAIPKTPVRMGGMEIGNLSHADVGRLVAVIMLLSSSPTARRLNEKLLVGDPFDIDVKLDSESKSRAVEIVNAYLKTMGIRLTFKRVKKDDKVPMLIQVMDMMPLEYKEKFHDVLQKIPYYLKPEEVDELKDELEAVWKERGYMPVLEMIPEGVADPEKFCQDKETEKVTSKVLEFAEHSETKEEIREKIAQFDPIKEEMTNPIMLYPMEYIDLGETNHETKNSTDPK